MLIYSLKLASVPTAILCYSVGCMNLSHRRVTDLRVLQPVLDGRQIPRTLSIVLDFVIQSPVTAFLVLSIGFPSAHLASVGREDPKSVGLSNLLHRARERTQLIISGKC